jgi:hypothetical protein
MAGRVLQPEELSLFRDISDETVSDLPAQMRTPVNQARIAGELEPPARHPSHVTDLRNLLSRFAQFNARIKLIMRYSPSSIAIRSKKSSNGSIAFSDCECPPAPLK